jgi:hypothetical protein
MTLGDGVIGEIGEDCTTAEPTSKAPIHKTRLNMNTLDSCRMGNP